MAIELTDRAATVDGWPLHLRLSASGEVDVVFIHGIPGSGRSWDAVLECLPERLRPIVPDLLGFGASGRPTGTEDLHAEGQARRLEEALEQCGAHRPILVGHDFGGPVALRLVMRAPDRYAGLILAATNAFGDAPIPFPLSLVNAPVVGALVAHALFSRWAFAGMCRFGARKGRVDLSAALGDGRQTAAIRTIFAASLTRLQELYGPIQRALPDVGIPALVVWGDRDPFFPVAQAERTAEAIPGARLTMLEGCGHFLPEEEPEKLAVLIDEFASGVAARG